MEVFNLILVIVFLAVSVIEIAKHVDEGYSTPFTLIFFIIAVFACIISILRMTTSPKDSDVLNGTAEYVETIHISNGDTTKTYHIQYKDEK